MDGSASLLQALVLQSNCWLCRCAGVKIGRESCDNSLHQLSVRARDPPLTVTTHHHHPHGRLCNAQPSELSAALVTASNKSFYFSLLAGWCRAVNGTPRISQCPKKALTTAISLLNVPTSAFTTVKVIFREVPLPPLGSPPRSALVQCIINIRIGEAVRPAPAARGH